MTNVTNNDTNNDTNQPLPHDDAAPKTLVEFVSADPTGPLSLHRARNGVIGDAISRLLLFSGRAASVSREFYVNDAASGLRHAARALWAKSDAAPAPLAHALRQNAEAAPFLQAPFEEAAPFLQAFIAEYWLTQHQETLQSVGVRFDRFFKESELHSGPQVAQVLAALQETGAAAEDYGALWLRASQINANERDYVLRRADGSVTYLAADLAYHKNKFERGYQKLVDVWSGDHEGYIGRTRAGLSALGFSDNTLCIVLCDTVRVLQNGAEIAVGGGSVADLIRELGAGTTRLSLLLAPENAPLILDVAYAKSGRGGAARIFRAAQAAKNAQDTSDAPATPPQNAGESALWAHLDEFDGAVQSAAQNQSPFCIAQFALRAADLWEAAGAKSDALAGAAGKTMETALEILGLTPEGDLV